MKGYKSEKGNFCENAVRYFDINCCFDFLFVQCCFFHNDLDIVVIFCLFVVMVIIIWGNQHEKKMEKQRSYLQEELQKRKKQYLFILQLWDMESQSIVCTFVAHHERNEFLSCRDIYFRLVKLYSGYIKSNQIWEIFPEFLCRAFPNSQVFLQDDAIIPLLIALDPEIVVVNLCHKHGDLLLEGKCKRHSYRQQSSWSDSQRMPVFRPETQELVRCFIPSHLRLVANKNQISIGTGPLLN